MHILRKERPIFSHELGELRYAHTGQVWRLVAAGTTPGFTAAFSSFE